MYGEAVIPKVRSDEAEGTEEAGAEVDATVGGRSDRVSLVRL